MIYNPTLTPLPTWLSCFSTLEIALFSKHQHNCGCRDSHTIVFSSPYWMEPKWTYRISDSRKVDNQVLILWRPVRFLMFFKLIANSLCLSIHIFSDARAIVDWICNFLLTPLWCICHIIKECVRVINCSKKLALFSIRRYTNNVARNIVAAIILNEFFGFWSLL